MWAGQHGHGDSLRQPPKETAFDERHERSLCRRHNVAMTADLVHVVGSCRVCDNGELVFSVMTASGQLIIECLECLTGYEDPRNLDSPLHLRMEDVDAHSATRADVLREDLSDLVSF